MQKMGFLGFGWLAERMIEHFDGKFEIYTTTTSTEKLSRLSDLGYNPSIVSFSKTERQQYSPKWALSSKDTIVVTVPYISKRKTKEEIKCLGENICAFLNGFKGQLIVMSTIGVYPQKSGVVTEADAVSEVAYGEELIQEAYPDVTILRLGGLMGDNRRLSNYNVREIENAVNHIHYNDIARLLHLLIKENITGATYNVVTPNHPSKEEVVAYQKGFAYTKNYEPKGKVVSSEKVIQELGFEFTMNDVRVF